MTNTTYHEPCVIKVTRIANRFHARLYVFGKLYDEMACEDRHDIGWICRCMLRWFDKCSMTVSRFAMAARERQLSSSPEGRVFYAKDLEKE